MGLIISILFKFPLFQRFKDFSSLAQQIEVLKWQKS